MMFFRDPSRRFLGWIALLGLAVAGCIRSNESEVVVYTALDREFSEPIFDDFTRATGIRVRAKYDTEANKTVGLVNLILQERQRPRCDVFWNNEILHGLRLGREGLLEAYAPPAASNYPDAFQSPQHEWHGFAARARVLLVNTQLVTADQRPRSIRDLIDARWQGKTGIAKPLFGTTATHAACLFTAWGDEDARRFFAAVVRDVKIFPGNRQVAQAVSQGRIAFGLTDTDDAIVEIERGMPVEMVYPDQEPGGLGVLFIPNTLGLIRGAPHRAEGQRLIDFLLSPETEKKLSESSSAQIPLQRGVPSSGRVATPSEVKPMQVDFKDAAENWGRAAATLAQILGEPAD